jgi:hypothetical protein
MDQALVGNLICAASKAAFASLKILFAFPSVHVLLEYKYDGRYALVNGTANPSRSGMARGLAGGSGLNRQDPRSRRVCTNRDSVPSNTLPEFPVGLPKFPV